MHFNRIGELRSTQLLGGSMEANLSFDAVKEAIEAHKKELALLVAELPKACERQGHCWSNPKRDDICVDPGDWVEGFNDGESLGPSSGYYRRAPEYREAYSRTCKRCGIVDQRKAIKTVRSPFEST